MNSKLSVLIHTFDQYSHLWHDFSVAFATHWDEDDRIPVYFGTDVSRDVPFLTTTHVGDMIFSGRGEWSDRLMKLLLKIDSDYVLYMQEDHYLTQPPPDLGILMHELRQKDLFRLQISPVNRFYTLEGAGIPLFFDPNSKYLVSHQPSIWKKSFLLECLKPGETPWKNEYEGTKRLQQTSQTRDFIREKIAIYPYDWYKHMCIKGQIVEP